MSYDYAGYRRRQYDFPQATQPFRPYQPVQPRRVTSWDPPWTRRRQPTCWDPPWTRRTTAYQHSSSYELDMYSPSPPKHRPMCWDPPAQQQDRGYPTVDRPRRSETCWDRPRPREEVRARVQPDSHQPRYSTEKPTRDLYSQPARVTSQTSEQPHLPLIRVSQAEKSERSRLGLCWHCPEKWVMGHVCKQRILCYADDGNEFEENIQDENLAEEKTDNTPTIVFGDDVPNDITVVHNGGAPLDVPNNESPGEFVKNKGIVKNDNESPQVLVGVYDEKIDDKEETLLEDKEEDGSIGEVEKIIASFNVAQMSLKDVANCWGKKGYGAYTDLPVIAFVYVDLNVTDVPSINHRSTSLDTDARLIPPRNDRSCLSILGGVDKLVIVAWNFADHIGSLLLIFYGCDEGRRSTVRWAFDPGGDASPKLLLSTFHRFVVPTLRTRWILTEGELIRVLFSLDILYLPYLLFSYLLIHSYL